MSSAPEHEHAFAVLTPDFVMDAVESLGFLCDARVLTLNSYENRVFQIGIEDSEPVIGKFYRPQRWTAEQILEEHQLTEQLAADEISVIPPLRVKDSTLFQHQNFLFSLYPRKGGRSPDLESEESLTIIGRAIGRMHSVAAQDQFRYRPQIGLQEYGYDAVEVLLAGGFVPADLIPSWQSTVELLLARVETIWSGVNWRPLRLHGDCHMGNVIWRDDEAYFVDFDDARTGPAVQDLWMMLSGDEQDRSRQMQAILEGYRDFHDFDLAELNLVEALRSLRLLYHSAWLARRWDDPTFPLNFPWFASPRYWSDQILQLREQLALLDEPPIQVL